jgi:hypothetical protein
VAQILKERVAPGIWIDQDDALHISIPEILDHFGWPHDEENINGVKRAIETLMRQRGFNQPMIFQEKCPHCGAGVGEQHKEGCPLRD